MTDSFHFKHPDIGVSELARGSDPSDWPDIGTIESPIPLPVPQYHVTLFWHGKKDPDEFDVEDIGPYRTGLYQADGMVMCIRRN